MVGRMKITLYTLNPSQLGDLMEDPKTLHLFVEAFVDPYSQVAATSRSDATLIAQLLSSISLLFLTSLFDLEYSDQLASGLGPLRLNCPR